MWQDVLRKHTQLSNVRQTHTRMSTSTYNSHRSSAHTNTNEGTNCTNVQKINVRQKPTHKAKKKKKNDLRKIAPHGCSHSTERASTVSFSVVMITIHRSFSLSHSYFSLALSPSLSLFIALPLAVFLSLPLSLFSLSRSGVQREPLRQTNPYLRTPIT